MVFSERKSVPYGKLSQELAPSSAPMALQQSEQEEPLEEEAPTLSQLNNQNSVLSLTLDEFQSKSGKNFGSMNMDEFLASILSSDDNQVNPPSPHDEAAAQSKSVATEPTTPPTQQGSFSVPPPICKKTVDEVWSEIHKGQPQKNIEAKILDRIERLKKQQTLGEMTLEDFLIKAGVVQASSSLASKTNSPQPRTTMQFQNQTAGNNTAPLNIPLNSSYGLLRPAMGIGFSTQHDIGNSVSSNGLGTYQMLSQNNSLVIRDPPTSCAVENCQSLQESSGSGSRKRIIDGPPEVVVERRQRRMLKNRESAARSRARKQAYTVELEAELNQLKQENDNLKKFLAEVERKRKQEISQRKNLTQAQKRTENLRAMGKPISASW